MSHSQRAHQTQISKEEAHKTFRAAHAHAAQLSSQAADLARQEGLPILDQFHRGNAERNDIFMLGDKQDYCFAEISKTAALHTIARENRGTAGKRQCPLP